MRANRKNLDLLLGQNRWQTARSLLIYGFQALIAYLFLVVIYDFTAYIHFWWLVSLVIGVGSFIDQIIQPDENSKLGYLILLAFYYITYKVVFFGLGLFYVMMLLGIDYEIHFFEEALPILTIFIYWTIGQKVGYYFEHQRILKKVAKSTEHLITDIDKLKIFLYQVHRRSFLKMMIQRGQAKFEQIPNGEAMSTDQFQHEAKLAYLSMRNFLKFLKITHLPQSKYITFKQLQEIDFSKNKIKEFSTYLFKIFPNVRIFDMSNNKIKKLDHEHQEALLKYTGRVVINFDKNPLFSES